MESWFIEALEFVIQWEGGFVNHPADPGGATNRGVTQNTYNIYRKNKGLPTRSVRYISDEEVREIYYQYYYLPIRRFCTTRALTLAMFDTAVNFGVVGAIQFLQEAIGTIPDGIWGPISQKHWESHRDNPDGIARKIALGRMDYRYKRVRQNPSQRVFLAGWLNRDRALLRRIEVLSKK